MLFVSLKRKELIAQFWHTTEIKGRITSARSVNLNKPVGQQVIQLKITAALEKRLRYKMDIILMIFVSTKFLYNVLVIYSRCFEAEKVE